jgi:hypothetical protein
MSQPEQQTDEWTDEAMAQVEALNDRDIEQ